MIGPLLFTRYIAPIQDIIRAYNMESMFYGDDTQIYNIFNSDERDTAIARLNNCLSDIRAWSANNNPTMNDEKTEVTHFTTKFYSRCCPDINIHVGGEEIPSRAVARNLGAMIDEYFTIKAHVNRMCSSAMAALRKIGGIRYNLDQRTAEMLVHAFVTSTLDSSNALLGNLPDSEINKLQRVQNIVTRIVNSDFSEAILWYNFSLSLLTENAEMEKPNIAKLQRNRASSYINLRQYQKAEEAMREAERNDPSNLYTYFLWFKVAIYNEDNNGAVAALQKLGSVASELKAGSYNEENIEEIHSLISLAAQLAFEWSNRKVAISALESLVKYSSDIQQILTCYRCLTRLRLTISGEKSDPILEADEVATYLESGLLPLHINLL
ncbi:uncharacterized protein LOC135153849 [Lytechinus pictus]|uniref:uncharacterized protein LOC135153849 n=1 Tax=Lytechinus pictus TaxID=7653 RepID=UPI0030BA1561